MVHIPEDISFWDLQLTCDADGTLHVDETVLRELAKANGMSEASFLEGPQIRVTLLIMACYEQHLRGGGARDPDLEPLYRELMRKE